MAKKYEVVCPYCKFRRTVTIAEHLPIAANGIGIGLSPVLDNLGTTILSFIAIKLTSKIISKSVEHNWFDLKEPCPKCKHTFSFNTVTGKSRE